MKYYTNRSVFDAALARIGFLFDEFENVVINVSGGKDSTVVLNLALRVAEERGRLPLNVLFIDQEAEWEGTVDMIREIMYDPRVKPFWLQVPVDIFNATSTTGGDNWLHCWAPDEEGQWIRERDPIALTENRYGTKRFKDLFNAFLAVEFPGQRACNLAGVRCEESPGRFRGLTGAETYHGETWGHIADKKTGQYNFYPIYDWTLSDVWKAIHNNGWAYNRIYDAMYQRGVGVLNMRISNVHHETAIKTLYILQEIEPQTWERITGRLQGINTAGTMQQDGYALPENPPFMFRAWWDYRDYLLDHLIQDLEQREKFRRTFAAYDAQYEAPAQTDLVKTEIRSLLANDYFETKLGNFRSSHSRYLKRKVRRNGPKIFTE